MNEMRIGFVKSCFSRNRSRYSFSAAYSTEKVSRDEVHFRHAQVGDFFQCEPQHENPFSSDSFVQTYLSRVLPRDVHNGITSDLHKFGQRCASEIQVLGRECETSPPYLIQTDAWGRRVDEIVTCSAWKRMKAISAEEGLISLAYSRDYNHFSRLYQMVKLYMFSPVSGLYSCPLAMTDGAAKTIQALKLPLTDAFNHLTSRDPNNFWTSGQWMTERRGGSDVSNGTETVAIPDNDGHYNLYGYKWFSSATDSDMSFTLARVNNSSKLSMFYLRTRDHQGKLNGIQVMKMKNKLGTRQLPTAELLLDGCKAELVGEEGKGVANISNMLTITRLHNTLAAVSAMRKILSLARDYSRRRVAFKNLIYSHPLHIQTLSRMEVETRGCCALFLDLALKLGKDDSGIIDDQESLLLRLMTPVAKMFTAKAAMSVVSEGLECFGGQGYIEDTGLPGLLRDAQVLPIWEGTSSVMSLDVVRALQKTNGEALVAFKSRVDSILNSVNGFQEASSEVRRAVDQIMEIVTKKPDNLPLMARDLTVSLAHTYIAALLIEHAAETQSTTDKTAANEWTYNRELCVLRDYDKQYSNQEQKLVFENYEQENTVKSTFIR